ncbi:MAG: hypothetical protein J0H25_14915 [Rhizobiales bacterium]|jgi:hypothetical protein|nr:hypothetical protein [Hyphomicrobiales bacterium]
MTHAKTAASTAEMITAVHISNLSNGIGHPLSWNYTVSASAAECHAATRKWIEAFGVGVNDTRENLAGETITVTVINVGYAAATISLHGVRALTAGHSVTDKHLNRHAPNTDANENCADTRVGSIADTGFGSIASLTGPEAANQKHDSEPWIHRRHDVNRTNFLVVLVIAFYTVATAVSVYSAAAGSRDAIGYLASLFVFGSFGCRTMVPLRLLALASNVAFMTYAVRNQLTPVLVLHALLLPTNIVRLWQILATRRLAWHLPHLSQDST